MTETEPIVQIVQFIYGTDVLVRELKHPQLVEYAPNTVENKLSLPDDLTLERVSKDGIVLRVSKE